MIPILYPIEQTIFMGNGLAPLYDAISCKCTEILNGSYEIDLQLPANSTNLQYIKNNCSIKVKPNYSDPPQIFRIYSIDKKYNNDVSIKAAHISYDTCGIPILPFTAETLDAAIDNLNTNRKLLSESRFVLNSNFSADGRIEVKTPTSFRSLLGGSENSISEIYGGEYHYDNYTINLLDRKSVV